MQEGMCMGKAHVGKTHSHVGKTQHYTKGKNSPFSV